VYVSIKAGDECDVFVLAQDLIQEGVAGGALRFQDTGLAAAGVNKQTNGEGRSDSRKKYVIFCGTPSSSRTNS